MTNEEREDTGRGPRGGRACVLLAVFSLAVTGCGRGPTGSGPRSPEPPGEPQARETGEEDCRRFGRLFGLDRLAEELDALSPDPRDLAAAYASRAEQDVRDAAYEGCLAGARAVFAMEREAARIAPLADQAAEGAGCTAIETTPNEGQAHIGEEAPPPQYATTPAASGPHRVSALSPDVSVYNEPVDEPTAVHNLEHGYTVLYYRPEDPTVAPEVVAMLEGLARNFEKVVVAPHPGLPEDVGLALVAWRRLQRCPPTIAVSDAESVAGSFVLRFAGTDVAPEPLGP
ncbi:MAG TPA: DUF3105 domain-containing protein [Actinomycetota bacterium]|nr:DUF3105 domain-containing protein [Actinomycetota bacterium]